MQQLTQDRARPRTGRALARIAATLLLAAAVSQPELAHAAPYGGGSHAGGFGGFHGGGFSGLHHSVNPSLSLSAPTNSPLQEQMREDYATGLMAHSASGYNRTHRGLAGRSRRSAGSSTATPRDSRQYQARGKPTSCPPSKRRAARRGCRSTSGARDRRPFCEQ